MSDFISLGFENFINKKRVIAVLKPGSSPMRKLKEFKKKEGMLIDATAGKPTRSLVLLDNGALFLSSHLPETIIERIGYESKPEN